MQLSCIFLRTQRGCKVNVSFIVLDHLSFYATDICSQLVKYYYSPNLLTSNPHGLFRIPLINLYLERSRGVKFALVVFASRLPCQLFNIFFNFLVLSYPDVPPFSFFLFLPVFLSSSKPIRREQNSQFSQSLNLRGIRALDYVQCALRGRGSKLERVVISWGHKPKPEPAG